MTSPLAEQPGPTGRRGLKVHPPGRHQSGYRCRGRDSGSASDYTRHMSKIQLVLLQPVLSCFAGKKKPTRLLSGLEVLGKDVVGTGCALSLRRN